MKKWLFTGIIFTSFVVINISIMHTAEQPHLLATLLLGFFFYLIFGVRGIYGAMGAVMLIVLLAMIVHEFQSRALNMPHFYLVLFHLMLELVTISGGGGLAYWLLRFQKKVK